MGPSDATSGTGSLRAIRAMTNADVLSGSVIKALAGHMITLAQLQIDQAQALKLAVRAASRDATGSIQP